MWGDAAGDVIEAFGQLHHEGQFRHRRHCLRHSRAREFRRDHRVRAASRRSRGPFLARRHAGKQMAIDADLNVGLIDQEEAKRRRKSWRTKAPFTERWTARAKFVRGRRHCRHTSSRPSTIIGGIISAWRTEASPLPMRPFLHRLTVGDGPCHAIPRPDRLHRRRFDGLQGRCHLAPPTRRSRKQLTGAPKALGMAAAVMAPSALLPGMPPALPVARGRAAWLALDSSLRTVEGQERRPNRRPPPSWPRRQSIPKSTMSSILKMDDLRSRSAMRFLPLVNGENGQDRLTEQIRCLRRNLAGEMSFVSRACACSTMCSLRSNQYVIRVKESRSARHCLLRNAVMVMDPAGGQVDLPGHAHAGSRPSACRRPGSISAWG